MAMVDYSDYSTMVWSVLFQIKSVIDSIYFTLVSAIAKPINMVAKYVTWVSSKYWRAAFFVVLLVYTVGLLIQARSYSSDARLFPFMIGVPLILMIILYLVLTFSSRYSGSGSGIFDSITDEALSDAGDEGAEGSDETTVRVQRELKMVLWVVSLLTVVYFFGFLNAFLLFLFLFVYTYEQSLLRATLITTLSLAFVQIFFVEFLSLPLWEGALFNSVLLAAPRGWWR
ncbi:tripartite tricarboxylate transporter TctB family protein [Natrinema soli]|uniref:Tripartite tricarboxylate transporter TctB family protein n=1 Tax=Natrinema soli TaxID=1930624 RepID=A0ABD5SYE2_9EURY|nr:tripartite tricarboxylate transporter TctB family protein [Natrinema soli]